MTITRIEDWLEKLGYATEPRALHKLESHNLENHPYAPEIKALLDPEGAVHAQAVFDVEGVPTVVFLGNTAEPLQKNELDLIRQKIWNQNLANIVLELNGETAIALPARKLDDPAEKLNFSEARPDGHFSAIEVASANLSRRLPNWFDIKARVDSKLLGNLSTAVKEISKTGYTEDILDERSRKLAELLLGQVLFISYLEHREIVGSPYRSHHDVDQFHNLVSQKDRKGLRHLIDCLREDFNGDFLNDDRHDPWISLNDIGFGVLDRFLSRTDMQTGQGDFWNYDFSFIPVELLSGLYESFLSSEEKESTGAYYTPRNLAMLAVDQAFAISQDPLSETIFDGACGSGILLTTAYRRLIALRETRFKRLLSFKERRDLLVNNIFGADINQMACRVSAFSLYLSLLEGLDPSDILAAQERENIKLPSLAGRNLLFGKNGDFFAPDHGFAGKRFSLLISNPPWGEAEGQSITTADHWVEKSGVPIARRQIAGAFALRALDFLKDNGRICLILPIALFVGPSNGKFVSHLFKNVQPSRLINFGDLQNLLFPSAEHTCHLFIGINRSATTNSRIPINETFDYCIPKADMSLAYGRLTMQSADRHKLQTTSVIQSPQLLVTLMWGDSSDLSLIARLELFGTLGDFWKRSGGKSRWTARKGVHFVDRSVEPVSAEPLQALPFVPVPALKAGVPLLHPDLLTKWPIEQETVAHINKSLFATFDGPRVLYPDGFSREEHSLRSVYYDRPATFSTSIGVIAGPKEDAALLKFVSVYLRSSLARYFLMMRAWKMLCERNAVHLKDIANFPFFEPKYSSDPEKSNTALAFISMKMAELASIPEIKQLQVYGEMRDALDDGVFDYFDVSQEERALVRETVKILMPSIRPRSYRSLNTLAQQPAHISDLKIYGNALEKTLTTWRMRTEGQGQFTVDVISSDPGKAGPMGIVRIDYNSEQTRNGCSSVQINNDVVIETLQQLRNLGLSVIPSGDALQLVPDTFVWAPDALFLVRSMTRRNWTLRQALRDAESIVREVQGHQRSSLRPEVA